MNKNTLHWLNKLAEEGEIISSKTGTRVKREISGLLQSGVIKQINSGAGSRYKLMDKQSLIGMLDSKYPDRNKGFIKSPRADAVRRYRNTKLAGLNTPTILNFRGNGNDTWSNGRSSFDVSMLTHKYGVASLAVYENDDWFTESALGLIENEEPFFYSKDFYGINYCSQFICYKGWIKSKILRWLKHKKRAPKIVLFPDFDPVGLTNYMKARKEIGDYVELAVPQNIEFLIQQYGNEKILKENTSLIPGLLNSGSDEIVKLVKLMQKYGCALEQELCNHNDLVQTPIS